MAAYECAVLARAPRCVVEQQAQEQGRKQRAVTVPEGAALELPRAEQVAATPRLSPPVSSPSTTMASRRKASGRAVELLPALPTR
jgi:hypothetical protein